MFLRAFSCGVQRVFALQACNNTSDRKHADSILEKYVTEIVMSIVTTFFSSPFSDQSTTLQVRGLVWGRMLCGPGAVGPDTDTGTCGPGAVWTQDWWGWTLMGGCSCETACPVDLVLWRSWVRRGAPGRGVEPQGYQWPLGCPSR